MTDPDILPDEATWDALGNKADMVARKALTTLAMKAVKKHGTNAVIGLIASGGMRAVAELARIGADPTKMHLAEEMLVAYLRGAIRGLDHPVHEDGRRWSGEFGHG